MLSNSVEKTNDFVTNIPSAAVNQQTESALTTAFQAFGPIALFNYLTTTSERIDWCRVIMRTFLQRSREYRYQLTAQDILDSVRATFDPTYTLDACKGDLERLVGWGNLATLHDTSRVTSIADFRSPILRYQATPEAIEVEAFLAEHARLGASEGGLHQGDLPRLWEALQQIDSWLQVAASSFTPERHLEIAERWHDAFTTWEKVTNDAAQYLGSMNRSAQQTVGLETFLLYKSIVVTYVQSFAQQLVQHSNLIRVLLAKWSDSGRRTVLLEIIGSFPPPAQQLAENQQAQEQWREDVQRQLAALEHWFTQGNNVEMFRKAAHDAVEKVVHRAHSLASSLRPHTDYVTMLHTLATRFLQIEDVETAQQLFAAAFANSLPIHLPEGLTGSPSVVATPGERRTWQDPATVTRTLRPIYKANLERAVEQPMRRNEDILQALRAEHEAQFAAQQQRFARLFRDELLDVGNIGEITPTERNLLTEIIDNCLGSELFEYEAPDGSTVTLLNRDEDQYISLQCSDGILVLPRYHLQRQRKQLPVHANYAIARN